MFRFSIWLITTDEMSRLCSLNPDQKIHDKVQLHPIARLRIRVDRFRADPAAADLPSGLSGELKVHVTVG
jgi:hypothetical protein